MEIEGVAPDDRDRAECQVFRYLFVVQYLLAGPFVNAARTRAGSTELGGIVSCFGVVRPLDRDLAV